MRHSVASIQVPARARRARPRGHSREPLHRLVQARRFQPRAGTRISRAVFGVLEPVPGGAARQGLERRDARGDARLQGDPRERDRGRLSRTRRRRGARRHRGQHRRRRFHFRAAHFELLVRMARQFGLGFADLGKRRFGTETTLFFCDELQRLYAHERLSGRRRRPRGPSRTGRRRAFGTSSSKAGGDTGERPRDGSSISGFSRGTRGSKPITPGTRPKSLRARSRAHDIDQDRFVHHANEMLDAVLVFWRGLDEQRRSLAAPETTDAKAG